MDFDVIVGIDFSIRSTGICIFEYGMYKWISISDNIKWNNKPYKHHSNINDLRLCKIVSYDREHIPKKTNKTYDEVWLYKLDNAKNHTELILREMGCLQSPIFAFEGFSYGSKGNSFIDLIVYNTYLKSGISRNFIYPTHTIAPKSLKKWFTGNGNASKVDMFNSFINSKDPYLKEDEFHKYCKGIVIERDNVPKPIEDLVDAYAVCKYQTEQSNQIKLTQ